MAAVNICSDFGAQKIKLATVSTVSPFICHEVMGLDDMILVFCVCLYFIKSGIVRQNTYWGSCKMKTQSTLIPFSVNEHSFICLLVDSAISFDLSS